MILLDTNIVSEMMKVSPSEKVVIWLDSQEVSQLFISTVTIAEIAYGINALPEGVKRSSIEKAFFKTIENGFKHRVLPFGEAAAHAYGKLMGERKSLGRPMSILDGQIAAIALSEDAIVATRNTRDFLDCELELVNPFR